MDATTRSNEFEFHVAGKPTTQGSHRIGRVGSRPVIISDNPGLKAWRAAATLAARHAWGGKPRIGVETEVSVLVEFAFTKPKSSRYTYPRRADIDKLTRALFDSITDAGVWADDDQVTLLIARKALHDSRGTRVLLQW